MSVDTSTLYENVLINRLSLKSGHTQYCEEYKESNNLGLGHGQDLEEYTSNGDRLCGLLAIRSRCHTYQHLLHEHRSIIQLASQRLGSTLPQPPASRISGGQHEGPKMEMHRTTTGFGFMTKQKSNPPFRCCPALYAFQRSKPVQNHVPRTWSHEEAGLVWP